MAKRLEITECGTGGIIPTKCVSYELNELARLSIVCVKDEVTRVSYESGYTEIVLSHGSPFRTISQPTAPYVNLYGAEMRINCHTAGLNGVTRIKIFHDNQATKVRTFTNEPLNIGSAFNFKFGQRSQDFPLSFYPEFKFAKGQRTQHFWFQFDYITKKGRVVPRMNYMQECVTENGCTLAYPVEIKYP